VPRRTRKSLVGTYEDWEARERIKQLRALRRQLRQEWRERRAQLETDSRDAARGGRLR
jgi:hypothetical protein